MKGAQVLLIIDNWCTLRLLSDLFAAAGARVSATSSGKQGLCRCHLLRPDLVILDLKLCDLDAWQIYPHICSLPDVQVILLTALGEEYRKACGIDLHGMDCVVKPFSFDDLLTRAHGAMSSRAAAYHRDPS